MDSRRPSRAVTDPKVRQVGFFTAPSSQPDATSSSPPSPPEEISDVSPSGNSLSPVMIPPPRNTSSGSPRNLASSFSVGESDFFTPSSHTVTSSDDVVPSRKGISGKQQAAASLPSGGFQIGGLIKGAGSVPATGLTTVSVVNMPPGITEKKSGGGTVDVHNVNSKPLKQKTSKAERRALQESQRAAKAAAKAEGSSNKKTSGMASSTTKAGKGAKPLPKSDSVSAVGASEKKGTDRDRTVEKERKKDVPHPRLQYDDESRVEKAKRRSVVKHTEARNRVELFRHLPQYEHGTQLPDLQSKFFQLDTVHPAVYKVGLQYLSGDISGGNARCIAMLQAFKEAIKDYSTPPEKTLTRDLTAKIGSFVSFLIECRPLSISMGNAIRFLKNLIAKLPLTLSESEAKASLLSDIDRFIHEKIIVAEKEIIKHAVTKIRDGDVLLTHGSSSAVEMVLLHAYELGKKFRVVVIDSRPKFEGKLLVRRLVEKGLSCTYTNINAISYIMHEVTRVFLGASSILSNGTVYSTVGTACVAMVAHSFGVPVLVCCEAYKFHERVQLDSICCNELGDPNAISKIPGRGDINYLDDWGNSGRLQLLNLIYDATPSDYVSMIVTDYGMVPPTSVPVIVRQYRREHMWI